MSADPEQAPPTGAADPRLAELDALSTEELRERAFTRARERRDVKFFWDLFRRLPNADDTEELDASLGAYGASVDEAVALWRQFTGHDYGGQEPLMRAAFMDYLLKD